MKRTPDGLWKAANRVGAAVICMLGLQLILGMLANAALNIYSPGTSLQNLTGLNEAAAVLVSLAMSVLSLGVPLLFFPLRRPPYKACLSERQTLMMLLLFLGFVAASNLIAGALTNLLEPFGAKPPVLNFPESPFAMLLLFVSYCVLPAFLEEYLFRGGIQRVLLPYGGWFAVLVTSLLFTLLHPAATQFPSVFLLSVFFGYAALASGGLRLPIFMHFCNNALSFLVAFGIDRLDGASAFALSALLFAVEIASGIVALYLLRTTALPRLAGEAEHNKIWRVERMLTAPLFAAALIALFAVALMRWIA